eukprot:7401190-Alexandrium_andersonii.AAC.1
MQTQRKRKANASESPVHKGRGPGAPDYLEAPRKARRTRTEGKCSEKANAAQTKCKRVGIKTHTHIHTDAHASARTHIDT